MKAVSGRIPLATATIGFVCVTLLLSELRPDTAFMFLARATTQPNFYPNLISKCFINLIYKIFKNKFRVVTLPYILLARVTTQPNFYPNLISKCVIILTFKIWKNKFRVVTLPYTIFLLNFSPPHSAVYHKVYIQPSCESIHVVPFTQT
jgi:hypothetical protein